MPRSGRGGGGYYRGAGGYGQGGGAGQSYSPPVNEQPQFTTDLFTYAINIAAITTLAVSNQNIQIQADSDFEWVMSTASGNLNGASEPWPDNVIIPITVLITDGGSGRLLENIAVPLMSLAGTGKQPFILPQPRRFQAKSTVNFTFTSYSASTWNNIFFNLIGRKIFPLTLP